MTSNDTDVRTLTTAEEKSKRFDHVNDIFMTKYLDLVWYARADKDKLLEEEIYEGLNNVKKIEEQYPVETKELCDDETNWQHGFNSGVLAYARFLATYVEDTLCPIDLVDEEIDETDIIELNGEKYFQMDGIADAEENFPELYT